MGRGDTFVNALIGAVVSVVTSFTGVGPLVGGAAAGYLQQQDGSAALKVGAISGAITLIPFVLFVLLFGSFLPIIPAMGGSATGAGIFGLFGLFFVVVLLIGAVYTVGLAALGGYIGYYIRENA
jgi:hypothetical protein